MKKIILVILSIFVITSVTPLRAEEISYLDSEGGGAAEGPFYYEKFNYTFGSGLISNEYGFGIDYHGEKLKSIDFLVSYEGKDYIFNEFLMFDEEGTLTNWHAKGFEIMTSIYSTEKIEEAIEIDTKYLTLYTELADKYADENGTTPANDENYQRESAEIQKALDEERADFNKDIKLKMVFTNQSDEQAIIQWGLYWTDFKTLFNEDEIIELDFQSEEKTNLSSLLSELEQIVKNSQNIVDSKDLYEEESYKRFEKSYVESINLLESANRKTTITEEEVQLSIDNLEAAISELVKKDTKDPEDNTGNNNDDKENKDENLDNKEGLKTDEKKKTPNTSVENNVAMYISILIISFATFLVVMKKREKSY